MCLNEMFAKKKLMCALRDNNVLEIPKCNTIMYGFNSLHCQRTILWKSIGCNAKNDESVKEVKRFKQ